MTPEMKAKIETILMSAANYGERGRMEEAVMWATVAQAYALFAIAQELPEIKRHLAGLSERGI